jgi:hypothetical protein
VVHANADAAVAAAVVVVEAAGAASQAVHLIEEIRVARAGALPAETHETESKLTVLCDFASGLFIFCRSSLL